MAGAPRDLPRRSRGDDRGRGAPPRPSPPARGAGGRGVAASRTLWRISHRRQAGLYAGAGRGDPRLPGALAGAAGHGAARRRDRRRRAGQSAWHQRQLPQLAAAAGVADRGDRRRQRHDTARRAGRRGAPAGRVRHDIGMSDREPASPIVRATYRLQFHQGFTFRDATALVPYLARLGISHIYASPLMEARPGSTHGYDIINHNRLNPEIGTEAEFAVLVAALKAQGMGLILDIVPNHMAVGGADNVWWLDVLEWGEASPYAAYFDINWDALRDDLKGRVLLPVLGDQYGAVLERGEIALRFEPSEGTFSAWYYNHRFPISPFNYAAILEQGGPVLERFAADFAALRRLSTTEARPRAAEIKRRLAMAIPDPGVVPAIAAALLAFAGTPSRAASFRRLHRLLEAQAYRLASWRVAAEEINYRPFFNINDLAGLRIELPELFAATHRMVFAMVERGDIEGLRIDHIDGLFDPAAYCAALRQEAGDAPYIVVEWILARYERLPEWPIED